MGASSYSSRSGSQSAAKKSANQIPYAPGKAGSGPMTGGVKYVPKPAPKPSTGAIWGAKKPDFTSMDASIAARSDTRGALGSAYQDPYGGATFWDVLNGLQTPHGKPSKSGGSGGGSGGGGGGGGGSAVDPAVEAAFKNYLAQFDANDVSAPFAATQQRLDAARQAAAARQAGIEQLLLQGLGQTRGDSQAAYGQGSNALAALRQQLSAEGAGMQSGGQRFLDAFGAGQAQSPYQSVGALMGALQGLNTANAANADAMYAGRGSVYSGLSADAAQQQSQQYAQLQAKLEADRLAAEQQKQKDRLALLLQAAQSGVTLQ